MANIRDVDVKKFVRKNIVTQFGVAETLISNNGLYFESKVFKKYGGDLRIKNIYCMHYTLRAMGKPKPPTRLVLTG